jgi:hypothetical protein
MLYCRCRTKQAPLLTALLQTCRVDRRELLLVKSPLATFGVKGGFFQDHVEAGTSASTPKLVVESDLLGLVKEGRALS